MTLDPLRGMFSLALCFLFAFILLLKVIESIRKEWKGTSILNRFAAVFLVGLLMIWMFGWTAFDAYETGNLDTTTGRWISAHQQVVGYALAAIIAAAFAFMVGSIFNPPLLLALLALVCLGASIGDHMVIDGLTSQMVAPGRPIDQTVVDYYLKHPHMLLHAMQMFLLVIAAASHIVFVKNDNKTFLWIPNLIVSASIVINEAVIWSWRLDRF